MKVNYNPIFPIAKIDDTNGEYQDRLDYDKEHIETLAKDIEDLAKTDKTNRGQRDPIQLWKKGDYYQILAGFSRTRAMKGLGRTTIRADIYEGLTQEEADKISIGSNQKRYGYYPDELSFAVAKKKKKGYSIEQLSEMFALKKSQIYNMLTLSNMDKTLQYCLHHKLVTMREALELMTMKPKQCIRMEGKGNKAHIVYYDDPRPIEFQRLENLAAIIKFECPNHVSAIEHNPHNIEKYRYCRDWGHYCAKEKCEYYKGEIKKDKVCFQYWGVSNSKIINGYDYEAIPTNKEVIVTKHCSYQPIPELAPLKEFMNFDWSYYPEESGSGVTYAIQEDDVKLYFEKGIPILSSDKIRFMNTVATPEQKKIISNCLKKINEERARIIHKIEQVLLEKEKAAKEGKTVLNELDKRNLKVIHEDEIEELDEDAPEDEPEPTQEEIDRVQRFLAKQNKADHKV